MAATPKFTGLTPLRGGRPITRPKAGAKAQALPRGAAKPLSRPMQNSDDTPMPPLLPPQPVQIDYVPSGRTLADEAARVQQQQALRSALFMTSEDRQAESRVAEQTAQQQRQQEQQQEHLQPVTYPSGWTDTHVYNTHNGASPLIGLNPTRRMGGGPPVTQIRGLPSEQVPTPSRSGSNIPTFGPQDNIRRSVALSIANEMTQQDYEALSPRQQAAIQFNTGLVTASRQDQETGTRTTENTEAFLASVGITPTSQRDLNRYLNLEYLISPETIALMDDPANGIQTPTSSMGHTPGEITPGQQFVADARKHSEIIANSISNSLATSGSRTTTGGNAPIPGFGNTVEDAIIQDVYLQMIDSSKNWTTQDIVAGIAADNAAMGTNVTPEQVWDFTRANVEAVEFGSLGSRQEQLRGSGMNLATGIELTPLDIAEIRARYGL